MPTRKYLQENRLLTLLISRHSDPEREAKGKNLCDDEILRPGVGLPQNDKNGILQQSHLDWQYILETAKTEDIFYPVYRELLVLDGTVAKCTIARHSESEGRRISTMNRSFPFISFRVRMTKNDISQQSHDEQKSFFPEEARARFKQLYYAYISQSILLSQQISLILDKIEAKGIKTLVLKGPAIDALIYKEDYLRPRLDLDLAVKKEDFFVLENLLLGLGYYFDAEKESLYPIPEYLNSRLYTHKQSNLISVHAHRHIINNLYLMVIGKIPVDMERVWLEAIQYKEYKNVFYLKPELQLLYMCEHALKHDFERLIFLYEIERLVDSLRDRINWDNLVLLADEFKLSFALYYGLYFIKDILSADVPEKVLIRIKPCKFTLGERFFIRCILKKKYIKYLSYLVYLSRHKGLFKKAKFILRTVFPPDFTFLGYLIRLKRLIRLILS